MAILIVKDLPDELHRRLRARAWAHGRSLKNEIIACLETTVGAQGIDPETILACAASLRSGVVGWLTDSDLAAFRRAGRS
jgi:plasmid stability protein